MLPLASACHRANIQALGVVLTGMRRGVKLASLAARRRMLLTLEIPSKDRAYPWFLEWMASQAEQARRVPLADRGWRGALAGKVNQLPSHELAVETTYKQHENGASEALFNLVPGPGTHYFRYRGYWFQVRHRDEGKAVIVADPDRSSANATPSSWTCTRERHGRH
jgi:chaperone BCS1